MDSVIEELLPGESDRHLTRLTGEAAAGRGYACTILVHGHFRPDRVWDDMGLCLEDEIAAEIIQQCFSAPLRKGRI
jgi:hypothetical protein